MSVVLSVTTVKQLETRTLVGLPSFLLLSGLDDEVLKFASF
jgi:hypothetical protein